MVQMFPGVMLGIPLFLVLDNYGLIDTMWALLVTYLTFALAFSVWMLKGYFDGIPREIEEAALIDGANRLQVLWLIVLRLSVPGIVTVSVHVSPRLERILLRLPLPRLAAQDDASPLGCSPLSVSTRPTEATSRPPASPPACRRSSSSSYCSALTRGLIAGAMKGAGDVDRRDKVGAMSGIRRSGDRLADLGFPMRGAQGLTRRGLVERSLGAGAGALAATEVIARCPAQCRGGSSTGGWNGGSAPV